MAEEFINDKSTYYNSSATAESLNSVKQVYTNIASSLESLYESFTSELKVSWGSNTAVHFSGNCNNFLDSIISGVNDANQLISKVNSTVSHIASALGGIFNFSDRIVVPAAEPVVFDDNVGGIVGMKVSKVKKLRAEFLETTAKALKQLEDLPNSISVRNEDGTIDYMFSKLIYNTRETLRESVNSIVEAIDKGIEETTISLKEAVQTGTSILEDEIAMAGTSIEDITAFLSSTYTFDPIGIEHIQVSPIESVMYAPPQVDNPLPNVIKDLIEDPTFEGTLNPVSPVYAPPQMEMVEEKHIPETIVVNPPSPVYAPPQVEVFEPAPLEFKEMPAPEIIEEHAPENLVEEIRPQDSSSQKEFVGYNDDGEPIYKMTVSAPPTPKYAPPGYTKVEAKPDGTMITTEYSGTGEVLSQKTEYRQVESAPTDNN